MLNENKGVVTINQVDYDLSDGPLFLVSGNGGRSQVRQLNRDWSSLQDGATTLNTLAKEDPAIKQFVDEAVKSR